MAGDPPDRAEPRAADPARAERHKQARTTLLVLALMVAAVFLTWLAVEVVRARRLASGRQDRGEAIHPGPHPPAEWEPNDPREVFTSPYKAVGLADLEGDPGGIAPPAGAKRLFGFRQPIDGEVRMLGRYELAGTAEKAADHYLRSLRKDGFSLLRDSTDAEGARRLLFEKPPGSVTVALRTNLREAKIVIITVTVVGPTGPAAQK